MPEHLRDHPPPVEFGEVEIVDAPPCRQLRARGLIGDVKDRDFLGRCGGSPSWDKGTPGLPGDSSTRMPVARRGEPAGVALAVWAAAARRDLAERLWVFISRLLVWGEGSATRTVVPYRGRAATKREEFFVRYEGSKRRKSLVHKGENYFQPHEKSSC